MKLSIKITLDTYQGAGEIHGYFKCMRIFRGGFFKIVWIKHNILDLRKRALREM
jgi:hypothetical protein